MKFDDIHGEEFDTQLDFMLKAEKIILNMNSSDGEKSLGVLSIFKNLTPAMATKRLYSDYIYGMSKSLETTDYCYWYISGLHFASKCNGDEVRHLDEEHYDNELAKYALLIGLLNTIPESSSDNIFEALQNNGPLTVVNKKHPFNATFISPVLVGDFLNYYHIGSADFAKRMILTTVINLFVSDVKVRYALFSEFCSDDLDIYPNILRFFSYINWIRKNNSYIYYNEFIKNHSKSANNVINLQENDSDEENSLDLIGAALG